MTIETMHMITELSKFSTYISALITIWSFGDKYTVYSITTQKDLMLDWLFGDYLKMILCLTTIEHFVDGWGQSIVGDLETGGLSTADHVVWIIEVS